MSTIGNIWSCQKGPSVGIGCGGLVRVATPHNLSHELIMRVDYASTPFLWCQHGKSKKVSDFGGFSLKTITKDDMLKLRDLKAARLWMMLPAAKEVVLCKDCLFSSTPIGAMFLLSPI